MTGYRHDPMSYYGLIYYYLSHIFCHRHCYLGVFPVIYTAFVWPNANSPTVSVSVFQCLNLLFYFHYSFMAYFSLFSKVGLKYKLCFVIYLSVFVFCRQINLHMWRVYASFRVPILWKYNTKSQDCPFYLVSQMGFGCSVWIFDHFSLFLLHIY